MAVPPSRLTQQDISFVVETSDTAPIEPTAMAVPPSRLTRDEDASVRLVPYRRSWALAGLFGTALLGILLLQAIEWVSGLFGRSPMLGWAGLACLGTLAGTVFFWITREFRYLGQFANVRILQKLFDRSHPSRDPAEVRLHLERVATAFARAPVLAAGLAAWRADSRLDQGPAEAIRRFETVVLGQADRQALAVVRAAARDALGLVALSPAPLIDVLLFTVRAMRLLREVAEVYGQRPGRLGTMAIGRQLLIEAGTISAADFVGDAVSGFFGGTLVAKISAAAAEGAIGAQRMARFGLLAMDVCRPIPFADDMRPGLGRALPSLS